jgi:HlyD family secretion protein
MKKKAALAMAVIVVAGAAAFYLLKNGGSGNNFAHTGTIEAVEVLVSFQIPGKVASVNFEEGQTVTAGQVLATLDTISIAQEVIRARAALETAVSKLSTARARISFLSKSVDAQINGAEANLQKLVDGLRPQEVEAARLGVEKAFAEARKTEKEALRIKSLYNDGVVPLSRWESAQAAAQVAEATLNTARETLELAEIGTRQEDIQGARAALDAARAGLEEVKAAKLEIRTLENEIKLREADVSLASIHLDRAALTAPVSGTALTKSIEPGENVPAARPVTTLADLSEVKARFYVPVDLLGSLATGDEITVLSDASPGERFKGRISYISEQAEFTPKNILTREERTKLVYMVKAVVPNTGRELKSGMPVEILLGH